MSKKKKIVALSPTSVARPHESALNSISKKVKEKGVGYNDVVEASQILSTILSEKEIGKLFVAIKNGNSTINGLNKSVTQSSGKVIAEVEGNIFGIITEGKLRDIFRKQQEEQIKKGGPLYVISDSIKTVNDNLSTTARILKAILQLQMITMAGVLKNAQVETQRAEKLEKLSQKLLNSDIELKDLLDYSLELDDYVRGTDVKLFDIKASVDNLWKEIDYIQGCLTSVVNDAEQKITEAKNATEKAAAERLNQVRNEINSRITKENQETKEAAIKASADNLNQVKKEIDSQITKETKEVKEAAIKASADALGQAIKEVESYVSKKSEEAKKAAIEYSADDMNTIRQEMEENVTKRIDGAMRDSKKDVEKLLSQNTGRIKNQITLSYIIGGLGLVSSLVTLLLFLLNVI